MTTRRILTAIAVSATLLLTGCVEEPPPDFNLALCLTEKDSVKVAAMAFHLTHGRHPASLEELVEARFLQDMPPYHWVFHVVDDHLILDGPC